VTVVSEESSIYKVLVSPAQDPGGSSGSHAAQHSLILVDIVAVDGVDVVLHDSITRVFGDSRSDVAEIMDDAGLIVEKFVRDEAAAIRDVKMSILNTIT